MTKLEELRKLATLAAMPETTTEERWRQAATDFYLCATPQTILAMCNLMQQMRDALQSQVENISAYDDPEDTLFDHELHVVSALKAFDKFNKGE